MGDFGEAVFDFPGSSLMAVGAARGSYVRTDSPPTTSAAIFIESLGKFPENPAPRMRTDSRLIVLGAD